MKTNRIRNSAIAVAAFAAIGVSTGQAALTVNPYGESAVANELRGYSKADWATVNSTNLISIAGFGDFVRDDSSDNAVPFVNFDSHGVSLSIEELYSDAGYTNALHIQLGDTYLMQSKPSANTEGVIIRSNSGSDTLDQLVFHTNTAGSFDPGAAGDVHLYDDANLRTYVFRNGNDTHYVWALEDIMGSAARNDHDYNDYVFYAKLSAVPEPATVISGIAVAFLGLTVLRRRLQEKKAAA
jgi:hypothetical protein